jgi:hypothetical protein
MQSGHVPRFATRAWQGLLGGLALGVGGVIASAPGAALAAEPEFAVASAGKASASIVLPVNPKPEEQNAAAELATYLRRLTGAEFRTVAEDGAPPGPQIHVGWTRTALAAVGPLETTGLDADAVVMKCQPPERLLLLGRNPWGTEFAVSRFLYCYGGVRWYLPTAIGEHVPLKPTFTVPALDRTEAPAWLSRQWSAADRADGGEWNRRNLLRARFAFHHSLNVWLTPALFDLHPDWFPLRPNGERYRPREQDDSWQPCLTNPAVAEHVAGLIIAQFDREPATLSASLGVNDSDWRGYCQCERCKSLDVPGKQSLHGGPDYSNRFFTFANRVAERVAAKYPDHYLGCLAYNACENPPSFKVHPQIVPFLTNDRAQWREAAFAQADRDWIAAWRARCPSVALYTYEYGSGYVIPRVYPGLQGEYLRYGRAQGVKGWYAEIYCNWALDGPKAWLVSQLLWDADQKVPDLLADFYTNFFGPAREPMQRYFELCEQRWLEQEGEAVWFRYFFDARQLALFPPEVCRQARGLLEQAAALAVAEPYRTRVEITSKAFHLTELYSTVYHAGQALAAVLDTPEQAEATAVSLVSGLRAEQERRAFLAEVIEKEPLLKPVIPFDSRAGVAGVGTSPGLLWRFFVWCHRASRTDLAARLIAELERPGPEAEIASVARALWGFQTAAPTSLLVNGTFARTVAKPGDTSGVDWESAGAPPGWSIWRRTPGEGKLQWVATGQETQVVLSAATGACFLQTAAVTPGALYVVLADCRGKVGPNSKAALVLSWQDAQGAWLDDAKRSADLLGEVRERWTATAVAGRAPERAATAVVMLFADNQTAADTLAFANVRLFAVPQRAPVP